MADKIRLDSEVFERGFAQSRERAKALIMAGQVYVNGQKVLKGGTFLKPEDVIEVRDNQNPFVSRGGYKLKKGIEKFGIELKGCTCMDIGASTGGFTDCMLMNGAQKVYAIDVGYGQLAWKLRTDDRVVNLERTNFRYITEQQIPEPIDFASVDVSFISLRHILPPLFLLLKPEGFAVCLIKPQFEAGRENVGKKGVVHDKNVHMDVINNVFGFALENGFSIRGLDYSPIKGPEGNIEYLMYISKDGLNKNDCEELVKTVVEASHSDLDKNNKGDDA